MYDDDQKTKDWLFLHLSRQDKRMHVYRVSRTCIYGLVRAGGGRVYEIKTLRSNLAPEEGGGRLFEGGV